jgi:hypothetical protein
MKYKRLLVFIAVLAAVLALAAFPIPTSANHSWNGYHWARTSNPFTLQLGDNVSGLWDGMLTIASSDWSQSTVLDTTIVAGGTKPRSCRPTSGRDEICSANYGNTGWLGVATIWITGGVHIVQGTVKNNDYYFGNSTYAYNNTAEMQHVICQEIGHTLGLDHQSTDGTSLNTCMDYYHNTSASDTKSTHPNQHDYDELVTIYTHLDSFTTVGSSTNNLPPNVANGDFSDPSTWGQLMSTSDHGRAALYERDFGGGVKVSTFVIYPK